MADYFMPFTTPALVLLLVVGSALVVVTDWRVGLGALALEYLGVTVLLTQLVIPAVAFVKLITALVVVGILGLTAWQLNFGRPRNPGAPAWQARLEVPTALPFRLMAVVLAVVSALYLSTQTQLVLPGLNDLPLVNAASYTLLALGLLNLGLTEEPVAAGMGLLTMLLGFETFYSAIEPSLAVVALLSAVELAIALAVSYMAVLQHNRAGEAAS